VKKTGRCTCPATFTLDGEERIEWPNPSCGRHGLTDSVREHHLMKYAREIEYEIVYAAGTEHEWRSKEKRLETPREVQERLYAEAVAA
jgi:hypothetical protein